MHAQFPGNSSVAQLAAALIILCCYHYACTKPCKHPTPRKHRVVVKNDVTIANGTIVIYTRLRIPSFAYNERLRTPSFGINQWWRLPPGKSADQLFQKIAQQKAILIFSAILAKRGNLNLDLNLDLHGSKISAVLTLAPVFFVLMLYESNNINHSWYDRLHTINTAL